MTYKQAYDKIIDAYFKDEIKPFNCEFCFCGTLSKDENWHGQAIGKKYIPSEYNYSKKEYGLMERALFSTFPNDVKWVSLGTVDYPDNRGAYNNLHKNYEEFLFAGMCAALDVLKQIHKERGENVEEDLPAFTQRKLLPTT